MIKSNSASWMLFLSVIFCIAEIFSANAQQPNYDYIIDRYADTLTNENSLYDLQKRVLRQNIKVAIPLGDVLQVLDENNRMFYIDKNGNKFDDYRLFFMSVDDIIYPLPYGVMILPKTKNRKKACWVEFIYVSDYKEQQNIKQQRTLDSTTFSDWDKYYDYWSYWNMCFEYDFFELKYNPWRHEKEYNKYLFDLYDLPTGYKKMRLTSNEQTYARTGDRKQLSKYWIIASKKGKHGVFDIRDIENSVLPFVYNKIEMVVGFNIEYLLLERKGLKCYYPLSNEPKYKELGAFIYNFARFRLPDGREGWLRLDGEEYFDKKLNNR